MSDNGEVSEVKMESEENNEESKSKVKKGEVFRIIL